MRGLVTVYCCFSMRSADLIRKVRIFELYLQCVEMGFYDSQTYKEEWFFFIQKRAQKRAKCAH